MLSFRKIITKFASSFTILYEIFKDKIDKHTKDPLHVGRTDCCDELFQW